MLSHKLLALGGVIAIVFCFYLLVSWGVPAEGMRPPGMSRDLAAWIARFK